MKGQEIPENARQRHDDVDAGPTQLFQGQERRPRQAPVAVKAGHRTQERQSLPQGPPFRLQRVRAPKHQRYAFGQAPASLLMMGEKLLRLAPPGRHRCSAR